MKKASKLFFILCLILSLCACSGGEFFAVDSSDKSYFVDFYTTGDKVAIECVLNIYSSADNAKVKISAVDSEDVEIGLLENETLTGETTDGEEIFTLNNGENELTVIFKGEYAGIYQITSRTIPRFITVTPA